RRRCFGSGSGCRRIVHQRQYRGTVEVVELLVVHRPEEQCHRHHDHQQGHRDQYQQDVHADTVAALPEPDRPGVASSERSRPTRSALSTTSSELSDMPMAASHGGTRPTAANGTAKRLYSNAQRRLCPTTSRIRSAIARACSRPSRRPSSNSRSACAWARSVPLVSAADTSAAASSGASLLPSPTASTVCPSACSERSRASLSVGSWLACQSSMSSRAASAATRSAWSPLATHRPTPSR